MTTKKRYISPEIEVMAMETQAFIALSNPTLDGGGEGNEGDFADTKSHSYSTLDIWDDEAY